MWEVGREGGRLYQDSETAFQVRESAFVGQCSYGVGGGWGVVVVQFFGYPVLYFGVGDQEEESVGEGYGCGVVAGEIEDEYVTQYLIDG